MKKNTIINILVSLFAIALTLIIAEVIMRSAWKMGGWVERPVYQRSPNPYLRYEPAPNTEAGQVHINSDGFRGREYTVTKPENTFRIAMMGDSETFSVMLPENDTLAAQLEELLNKKSKSLHYEVLNFGVEGYCTFQELETLKAKTLKYSPDLIILNYVLNDPEPGEYYFNKSFLMRHSALVRYFTYRIKKTMIKRERKKLGIVNEIDHYNYYHQPKYFSKVSDAIIEMADIARKVNGRKLIVIIFPTSSTTVKDFKETYPYYRLHALVKGIPSDNIIFIELIDEFNRLGLTPQTASINYVYNESHKNAFALKVSSEYIYEILKANKILPE